MSATEITPESDTKKFWVHCSVKACNHEWVAAHLPMMLEDFGNVLKRTICPKCANTKPLCGRAKK